MRFDQAGYDLRCEWGLPGLLTLAPVSDAVIVVDVLSFSTTVDIIVANGAFALPYPWKDPSAAQFAAEKGAVLAGSRASGGYSLSPDSVRDIPPGTRLVLPSPNGSALCFASKEVATFTACLRNAGALARFVASRAHRIAVIPAGERWPHDWLRPCVEDLVGAGAVLSGLPGRLSPEAEMALAAFERFKGDLPNTLMLCGSGQELIERGCESDVELAAEYGVSRAIPMLQGDEFVDAADPAALYPAADL